MYGTTLKQSVSNLGIEVRDSLHGGLIIGRHVELASDVEGGIRWHCQFCNESACIGFMTLLQYQGTNGLSNVLQELCRVHAHEPSPSVPVETKQAGKLYPWVEE